MSYGHQKMICGAWQAKHAMCTTTNRVHSSLQKACSVNIFVNAGVVTLDNMMRGCLSVLFVVQGLCAQLSNVVD